jgi:hypothetical protein
VSVRRRCVVLAVTCAALAMASSASAAVTIGGTFPPSTFACSGGTLLQSGSPAGQYAAPFAGVLTSWSVQAGAGPSQRKLKVARPAGGNSFTIVGESDLRTPTPNALNSYPVRIPVQPGDVIGFFLSAIGECGVVPAPGYSYHESNGDPAPGTTSAFNGPLDDPGIQLDVSATLEPDCDGDGFGDDTQDQDLSPCNPPPAKADRTLTLDADKSKVKNGKKVTLTGQLSAPGNEAACQAGLAVELQRKKPNQATFATLELLGTDAAGAFSTKEKVKKTFEYRAQVAETEACLGQTSNTEKVKVKKKK